MIPVDWGLRMSAAALKYCLWDLQFGVLPFAGALIMPSWRWLAAYLLAGTSLCLLALFIPSCEGRDPCELIRIFAFITWLKALLALWLGAAVRGLALLMRRKGLRRTWPHCLSIFALSVVCIYQVREWSALGIIG